LGSVSTAVVANGAFNAKIAPLPNAEYIIVAKDPSAGVGIQQSQGLIQVPTGISGSGGYAGWHLDSSSSPTLDLGTISPGIGGLLPSVDAGKLATTLGLDQAALYEEARSDGYLREAQNGYFNQNSALTMLPFHFIKARLWNAFDKWSSVDDVLGQEYYSYDVMVHWKDTTPFTIDDVSSGKVTLEFIPPADVNVIGSDSVSPAGVPIKAGAGLLARWQSDYFIVVKGAPVKGAWIVRVDGKDDGAWDLGLNSPFDESGHFVYFVPSIKVNTVPELGTSRVTGVELRYFAWNRASQAYEELKGITQDLPLAGSGFLQLATTSPDGKDVRIDLPATVGTVQAPLETIYLDQVPGAYWLNWVTLQYSLGDGYSFDFLSHPTAAAFSPPF